MDTLPFIDLKKQHEAIRADLEPRLAKVMGSAAFIQGPEVRELEAELASFVGARECVTCANGTDALVLPLMAWGVGPGDAVFVPTFTFIATAEVASLRGAAPVFVDVDPETFNMDARDLERKIAAVAKEGRLNPRLVVTVDLFGLPADYRALTDVAGACGVPVLEDAAQGFGGSMDGRLAGNFGLASATSFFPAKPLGCYGDGGAVFTDSAELAGILRSLRGHGAGADRYEHLRVGVNSRLDTLQAAVLLSKMKVFPGELRARERAALLYSRLLGEIAGDAVEVPRVPEGYFSSWAQYTVKLPEGTGRDAVQARMKERGVPTMVYYPRPLHLQPAYLPLGGRPGDCPNSERLCGQVLSLPMHPYLEEADQERVVRALKEALA
ncbi:MAG: DegT/DnrJ/EryC1/StrS family aminotransferase [Deltaproteobacteria bacterium]|jgi:dTDP-4-amino-4,6-dideoxygalactose transaminase|nr:DegT/DnrJ/EryC1/StrS family aminotransferase [Deltaproteobacteria bacterium]